MEKIIGETQSLCPECMSRIPAHKVEEDGNIYLKKRCSLHGVFKVLIWRGDAKSYTDWEEFGNDGCHPTETLTSTERGCPYDCGLCPSHKVNACTMVMEVTSECNLKCPICFANSGNGSSYEPDVNTLKEMYRIVFDTVGPCTIQLSGGEPTLRDDLPEIIALGREMGFDHILLNTNGIRLAQDSEYLHSLKETGLSAVYLQFDGVNDDVYRSLRGKNLLETKVQAIDHCAQERIGVVLVPVLIPKINDHQLGDIVRFAKDRIPCVKGIHFQPVSYLGRYPDVPLDKDRITIPDVLHALCEQTEGELKPEDFLPRGVKGSHCSFSGLFILRKDGRMNPLNNRTDRMESQQRGLEATVESSRRFMSIYWRFHDEQMEPLTGSCCGNSEPISKPVTEQIFRRIFTHGLTITCMPFQDVWNIDLQRLKGCCGHVVTSKRKIIPFCALYLTNANGKRLYIGDGNENMLCGNVAS
ncbi:MAG: radical SAM protein [Thermodesulfobacteriota bacterium]|nr:radical SAM protein [Thermodesulfobacteriota bacterium]